MAARFEVYRVFEITQRGRVVAGTILSGAFRIGTRVWAEHMPNLAFTIAGIEYLDDIRARQSWISFVSTDAPSVEELRQALPTGSMLTDAAAPGLAEAPHVA